LGGACPRLHAHYELALRDLAVGHARRVVGESWLSVAIEKNESASGVRASGENAHGLPGGQRCGVGFRQLWLNGRRWIGIDCSRAPQEVRSRFCENYFHDRFPVAGTGNSAGLRVRVTTAADQRRVSHAAGELAASAASASGGEQAAVAIEGYGSHRALFMAAMVRGGVRAVAAFKPGIALGVGDEFFGSTQRQTLLGGKSLGALANEHHVRTMFENLAREAYWIANVAERRDGARAQRSAVHYDGVAFHVPVDGEMRTEAGIEDGVIFQNRDGGLHRVQSGAAILQK